MEAALQQRFEARPAGRVAISAFLLITLLAMGLAMLPESRLREVTSGVAQPYLLATGMEQSWSMFAPDPRRVSVDLEARVHFANGTTAVWRPPAGGDLAGAQWDYRWRKWMENAIQDVNAEVLWRPTALYAARELRAGGARPVSVTLVRRWRDVPKPGAGRAERPWKRYAFYELALGERR
jgi:hypothetical protein